MGVRSDEVTRGGRVSNPTSHLKYAGRFAFASRFAEASRALLRARRWVGLETRPPGVIAAVMVMVAVVVSALALGGCSVQKAAPGPTVVLIGGGLEADNEPVLSACIDRGSRGVIVLVPWASGDQAGAAGNATKMFAAHAPGATIVVAPDPETDAAGAVAAIERVKGHGDLLYFTGGDQSRITKRVLAPQQAALLAKIREVAARPGVILGGTSAGAAVMSDPMFTGGRSDAALSSTPLRAEKGDDEDNVDDEPKVGPRLAPGLGLVKDVIVDTHFAQRGRLGRLIAAVEASGAKFGIGLKENRGVVWNGSAAVPIDGPEGSIMVDLRQMTRHGDDRLGVRVAMIAPLQYRSARGSTLPICEAYEIDADRGATRRAQEKVVAEAMPRIQLIAGTPVKPGRGPWAKNEVTHMIRRLAVEPSMAQVTKGQFFELTLRADERTVFQPVVDGNGTQVGINAWGVIADVRRVR